MTGDAPHPFAEGSLSSEAVANDVPAVASDSMRSPTESTDALGGVCATAIHTAVPRVREWRFGLFDYEAYARELAPLISLATEGRDGGLFSAWVHVNLDRLKHPERCTFLHEEEFAEEFEEFDVREYARFALTAYCEPETLRRLGNVVPAMHAALLRFETPQEQAARMLLGEPVTGEKGGALLTLSSGQVVGLTPPGEPIERALACVSRTVASLREPGASGRLLSVAGNGHANNSAPYVSAKALRRAFGQLTEVLEEARDYDVGLLSLYELDTVAPRDA